MLLKTHIESSFGLRLIDSFYTVLISSLAQEYMHYTDERIVRVIFATTTLKLNGCPCLFWRRTKTISTFKMGYSLILSS